MVDEVPPEAATNTGSCKIFTSFDFLKYLDPRNRVPDEGYMITDNSVVRIAWFPWLGSGGKYFVLG